MIKIYYYLTKPGIVYGNALPAIGGFFLAAKGQFHLLLFLGMLFGLSFVIASACVFNNYIDRDIDKLMKRTKKRALVSGSISGKNAIIFASILGLIGSLLLGFFTNFLTLFLALLGFFFYVVIYTYSKRKTKYGTLIGSISGAVPPVVGYCAVTNHFDIGALLLFLILVVWQMPHFYAIAIFRSEEYAAAAIPVLPIKQGAFQTKVHMFIYILAFIVATSLLTVFHYAGIVYLFVMGGLSLSWLTTSLAGFQTKDQNKWARKMFFLSLIIITVFSFMLSLNSFLP